MIRETEPLSLMMALREPGREQLPFLSTEATRSDRCAFMLAASGCD